MPAVDRLLVLLRHGQSEWNLKNLFTGWRDVDLTPVGVEEAKEAGRRLKARGIAFDVAFTSALIRAQNTLKLALAEMGQTGLPESRDQALNERDYGDLVGLNKDDARKKWGEEQVHLWRRSYDVQPPGGESLKDTVARALPYYCQNILPAVLDGKRVLVAAHGNSLRALVLVLDRHTPKTIPTLEIATGVPLVYRLNPDLTVASKEILSGNDAAAALPFRRRPRLDFTRGDSFLQRLRDVARSGDDGDRGGHGIRTCAGGVGKPIRVSRGAADQPVACLPTGQADRGMSSPASSPTTPAGPTSGLEPLASRPAIAAAMARPSRSPANTASSPRGTSRRGASSASIIAPAASASAISISSARSRAITKRSQTNMWFARRSGNRPQRSRVKTRLHLPCRLCRRGA